MSISIVQQVGLTGNSAYTASVSFTNPTTAGNLILIGVANEQFFLSPTISGGGNTYTFARSSTTYNGGPGYGVEVQAYYCLHAASCNTLNLDNTAQAANIGAVFAYEIAGVSAYDTAANGSSTGGTASCTLTTGVDGEMIYTFVGSVLSGAPGVPGYTALQNGSCGYPSFCADEWKPNVGSAGSNTLSLTNSGFDAILAVAFKPIVTPRLRTLMGWGL